MNFESTLWIILNGDIVVKQLKMGKQVQVQGDSLIVAKY